MQDTNFLEVKITIKDDSQKLVTRHAVYNDSLQVNRDDPALSQMVQDAIEDFKGDTESVDFDVIVNIKYTW